MTLSTATAIMYVKRSLRLARRQLWELSAVDPETRQPVATLAQRDTALAAVNTLDAALRDLQRAQLTLDKLNSRLPGDVLSASPT